MAPDAINQDRLYQALKAEYLSGSFRIGARIEMTTTADRYRVSPTPVRDAMNRLVGEKLLSFHPDGGFQIAVPDRERLLHLYAWNLHHLLAALHLATEEKLKRHLTPLFGHTIPALPIIKVDLLSRIFEAIGRATGSHEFIAAIQAANERLHYVRIEEISYFKGVDRELRLLSKPLENNIQLNVRRRLWAYHRRRFDHVAAIAGRLEPLRKGGEKR